MNVDLDQMVLLTPIGGGLCPLGYAAPHIDDQVAYFGRFFPTVVLLDIRLKAHSRWYPAWNKGALQAKWGPCYVHEKRLGNVNYQYKDRPIELFSSEAALPWVLEQLQQNVGLLLLCACQDYERCHRKVVTELILQRCADAVRTSGMRYDLARHVYVGVLPVGDIQVVVDPGLFRSFSFGASHTHLSQSDEYDP